MQRLIPIFASMGTWERVAILAVVLIVMAVLRVRVLRQGFGRGMREFDKGANDAGRSLGGIYGKLAGEALTPDNQTAERYDPRKWRGTWRFGNRKGSWPQQLWRSMHRLALRLFRSRT